MATWTICRLDRTHDRSSFDCGELMLNDWLKNRADQVDSRDLSRTFVATCHGDSRVLGYYAISSHRVLQEVLADGFAYVPDVTGKIHCVDAETGNRCWLYDTNAETWGGVLVADGKLYFGNQRSFHIFRAGSQPELLSKIQLGQLAFSAPIAANGTVYVASQRYLWAVAQRR